jgi:ABC-2 type transport system permease protein
MSGSIRAVPEVLRITLRQLLGRRRTLLLLLLAGLPAVGALIFRLFNQTDIHDFTEQAFDPIALSAVLPLTALLFGTGAFGSEQDDGTILYLLSKPVSRAALVLAKFLAAAGLTVAMTIGSVALAGAILLLPQGSRGISTTEAYVASMIVGSFAYTALFVVISLFTRRALILGIGYVLVWETTLSQTQPGIANFSVRQYALGAADAIERLHVEAARLSPTSACVLAGAMIVLALSLAIWRLQRFELPGGD